MAPLTVNRRLLVGVILAGTLSVLDSTLVVPLLTTIANDFGAGSEVSWLVAIYLLSSTVTIPVMGRWLDLRGERTPMWVALSLFLAGTVMAVFAPNLTVLIIARAIQGVGAGGVFPLGQAILAGRVSSAERARLQIYYNIAYGVAAGVGPVVGGALVNSSWRWAFVIIVPFTLIVMACLAGQLRATPAHSDVPPFDGRGSALMTVGLTLVLLGVERRVWWVLVGGVVVLAVFVIHARRLRTGLIPMTVLGNRVIMACTVAALLVGFVQFSFITYLPVMSRQEMPELNPGLVVVPLTVLWVTSGGFTGVLARKVGTKPLLFASAAGMTAAGVLVAIGPGYGALLLASLLVGASAGLALIPALLLAQRSAPDGDMGAATSAYVLLRNFGAALGVALTAVIIEDAGLTPAWWLLTLVGASVVLPVMLLPGPARERAALR